MKIKEPIVAWSLALVSSVFAIFLAFGVLHFIRADQELRKQVAISKAETQRVSLENLDLREEIFQLRKENHFLIVDAEDLPGLDLPEPK